MTDVIIDVDAKMIELEEKIYGKIPPPLSKPIVSPLSTLTEQQLKLISELQEMVFSSEWYQQLLPNEDLQNVMNNKVILFQYLKGFQWSKETALQKIKAMCEWRAKVKPLEIRYEALKPIIDSNLLQLLGTDRENRPIMYANVKNWLQIPNWDTPENLFKTQLYFAYHNERAYDRMKRIDPNLCYQVWIFDMKDASLSVGFVKTVNAMVTQIGEYYPERMIKCAIVNTGWKLNIVWTFAKNFLAQSTIDKFKFVKQGQDEELKKVLNEFCYADQVIQYLNGKVSPPNVADVKALDDLRIQSILQNQKQ